MMKCKKCWRLPIVSLLTLPLVGCESFWFWKQPLPNPPASTFCLNYKPVKGPDPFGSQAWLKFWDDLHRDYPEQSNAIRANNAAWQVICNDAGEGD